MNTEEKKKKIEEVAKQVEVCQRCRLYKTANRSVPGAGSPDTKVVFIGEGPGYHEDQQGLPFVGQAGKLLDQLLQSIKVKREDVFVGNVVKHRPPENRDPLPDEIEACGVWLDQQLEIIQPRIIVTLGRFSMAKFLPGEYISHTHGQPRFVEFQGRKLVVMPMYHPAAALRNGQIMEALKEDFLKIADVIGQKNDDYVKSNNTNEEKKPKGNEQLGLI